jgi:hypothetical protein
MPATPDEEGLGLAPTVCKLIAGRITLPFGASAPRAAKDEAAEHIMMKALPICPRRRWPMPASGAACRCASLHPGVGAVVNGHRIAGRALRALASRRFEPHLVSADDIVFGDADGLLFVVTERADEVLATAHQIWRIERDRAGRIRDGETLRQQTALRHLMLRAADPSYTFRRRLRRIGGAIEE